MELTGNEILGAFQLGIITEVEARERLGFKVTTEEEGK